LAEFRRGDDFLGGVGQAVGGDDIDAALCQDLAALFDFGAFQPHDQRHVEAHGLVRSTIASAIVVQRMMPPKMFTSTALTFGSLSRMRNASVTCSVFGAAADVQEVGRLAAVQLDDVHRAHRQPGAVDQAADVAVQFHVAQPRLPARTSAGSSSARSRNSARSLCRNRRCRRR
jgi:hypothetical protein